MGNLSKNFSLSELIRSETADRLSIDNTPTTEAADNLKVLVKEVLQPLRDTINVPIRITSGYRCKELNDRIGGAETSQHMKGEAADIVFDGMWEWFEKLVNESGIVYDQIIHEKKKTSEWVHISYREGKNRMQALTYRDGKYELYKQG